MPPCLSVTRPVSCCCRPGPTACLCSRRLPRDVPLRMVGLGMGLPTTQDVASVDRYLAKLKDAALHMRMLHAQFHYDAKLALSKGDIEAAWGR